MLSQSRSTRVFMSALISRGIGAVVLNILDNTPSPVGAFSLSEYYHLVPVEKLIPFDIPRSGGNWEYIEIDYIAADTDIIGQRYAVGSSADYDPFNYHFIVWNGDIGRDGQIQPAPKWQKQEPSAPTLTRYAGEQTIHICVITDATITRPSDFQIKRTVALVDALSKRFDIQSASIHYPDNWW